MKNRSVKVSVAVPVYNTKKYLRKCLDSLMAQIMTDIEFIIVDDASTDGSGDICDEYEKADSRFRVIHLQTNGGLSCARQVGLNAAIGEYFAVCDSDDWVEPDMYAKLYSFAKDNNLDIAMCGYRLEYENKLSYDYIPDISTKQGSELILSLMSDARNHVSVIRLVRRTLFTLFNIFYEPGINMGEDCLILYKLMKSNPKIDIIAEPFYHYRRLYGNSSYTNCLSKDSIDQLYYIYNWLYKNYDHKVYANGLTLRAVDIAFACLRVKDMDNYFVTKFLKKELKWKNLFKISISLKVLCVMLMKVFPFAFIRSSVKLFYPIFYK